MELPLYYCDPACYHVAAWHNLNIQASSASRQSSVGIDDVVSVSRYGARLALL
jgi:hypothetical protein